MENMLSGIWFFWFGLGWFGIAATSEASQESPVWIVYVSVAQKSRHFHKSATFNFSAN